MAELEFEPKIFDYPSSSIRPLYKSCLDCVGVGIGPSNLSLACLLSPLSQFSTCFLEREQQFFWHKGLLLEDSELTVSIFKDLVTLADPTSPYSFLSYLHSQGRLLQFIIANFPSVKRVEFNQYFQWVCERLANLHFGHEVREITFDKNFTLRGSNFSVQCNNLSIGVGHVPKLPSCAKKKINGRTLIHSSSYLDIRSELIGKTVAVIGGGQSGAEVFLDLINRDVNTSPARCIWVSRRPNFLPLDNSPFTNELFTPEYVKYFQSLSPSRRQEVLASQRMASDGITDSTLNRLYRLLYENRYLHPDRAQSLLAPGSELIGLTRLDYSWLINLRTKNHLATELLEADYVILATGYESKIPEFLAPIKHRLDISNGEIAIQKDFSACWDGPENRRIFVQNAGHSQVGISDPNLSLLAWRAGQIANSLAPSPLYQQFGETIISWMGSQNVEVDLV